MFSRRTAWSVTPNRLAAALAEYRRLGRPLLDLTQTNPTQVGLAMPVADIREALADARTMCYEPTPFGGAEARGAVAAYHGGAVPPERIVLTASTSEAYALLFKVLADPGDRVLVPVPSYPLFDYLAGLEAVEIVPYPSLFDGDGWNIDLPSLEDRIDDRTRAILAVSPNNPTGAMLRREEADRLLRLCRRLTAR